MWDIWNWIKHSIFRNRFMKCYVIIKASNYVVIALNKTRREMQLLLIKVIFINTEITGKKMFHFLWYTRNLLKKVLNILINKVSKSMFNSKHIPWCISGTFNTTFCMKYWQSYFNFAKAGSKLCFRFIWLFYIEISIFSVKFIFHKSFG